MEFLDLTKQAGGSYSHPDPLSLLRKAVPSPERGQRYPSGHDSELDVDAYEPEGRDAPLNDVPAIADPTLVQPDNRRTTSGWDSEQSDSEPRTSFDAAADDLDDAASARANASDSIDRMPNVKVERHPASGRFVATPNAQLGEPERVRDRGDFGEAPDAARNRTPMDALEGISADIDAAMGRANRVARNGNARNERNVQPSGPSAVTPKG
jgi:hypothetical protein